VKLKPRALWLFGASLFGACDSPPAEPETEAEAEVLLTTAPAALPPARVSKPAAHAEHAQGEGHHAVDLLHVDWPARASIDRPVVERLPTAERAKLGRAPVPVLVPRSPGLTDKLELVVRSQFVAASIDGAGEHKGVHVFVSATKVAHRYDDVTPLQRTHTVRTHPAWVLQNEGIWSATWEEHGVSYLVEVECAEPGSDARCGNANYTLRLAEDLAFVGGSFGRAEGAAQ